MLTHVYVVTASQDDKSYVVGVFSSELEAMQLVAASRRAASRANADVDWDYTKAPVLSWDMKQLPMNLRAEADELKAMLANLPLRGFDFKPR